MPKLPTPYLIEAKSHARRYARDDSRLPGARRVDVAVVGAGPAGLHAAIAASERGASVLVFDKKSTIGVPVKCGEFFPRKEEMLDLLPGCQDFSHLFEIPYHAISNTCEKLRIYSPKKKCWQFPFEAYVLDRVDFEQHLGREASKLGVEFVLGRPVRVFRHDGKLRVGPAQEESFEAGVIVAADGFPSMTVSSAGFTNDQYSFPGNIAINYQYVVDGLSVESDVTEMYMGASIAPGGYGWIIPKSRTTANVGVGIRTTFVSSLKGKEHLDYFMRAFPMTAGKLSPGTIRTMITDLLPMDGAVPKTFSNGLLSVGDCAGMVMATNGGGIPTAMVSGHIAGQVAALHIQRGEPLSRYEDRWKKAFGRELYASTRMRRFADVFMSHDTFLDWAMRILRTRGIKKVVTCKIPTGLGFLMKLLGY